MSITRITVHRARIEFFIPKRDLHSSEVHRRTEELADKMHDIAEEHEVDVVEINPNSGIYQPFVVIEGNDYDKVTAAINRFLHTMKEYGARLVKF